MSPLGILTVPNMFFHARVHPTALPQKWKWVSRNVDYFYEGMIKSPITCFDLPLLFTCKASHFIDTLISDNVLGWLLLKATRQPQSLRNSREVSFMENLCSGNPVKKYIGNIYVYQRWRDFHDAVFSHLWNRWMLYIFIAHQK